jgi:hypothetical protein
MHVGSSPKTHAKLDKVCFIFKKEHILALFLRLIERKKVRPFVLAENWYSALFAEMLRLYIWPGN